MSIHAPSDLQAADLDPGGGRVAGVTIEVGGELLAAHPGGPGGEQRQDLGVAAAELHLASVDLDVRTVATQEAQLEQRAVARGPPLLEPANDERLLVGDGSSSEAALPRRCAEMK